MARDTHAFASFALIGVGIFLVDSGIRGRMPVKTLTDAVRNPGSVREVFASHNNDIASVTTSPASVSDPNVPTFTNPAPNVPTHVAASVASEQAYAQSRLASYGWDQAQMPFLVELWNRESGWDPSADNKSSGAYGIPQSLPASKMASAGGDYLTNPQTQIDWGMGYIKERYGSPEKAWAHETSAGWY